MKKVALGVVTGAAAGAVGLVVANQFVDVQDPGPSTWIVLCAVMAATAAVLEIVYRRIDTACGRDDGAEKADHLAG